MNALLIPYAAEERIFAEVFPGRSIFALPLAGKMIAEYWLDLSSLLGIEEVRILDYVFDGECREALGSGERWSLRLQYTGAALYRGMSGVLEQHAEFLHSGRTLIAFGAALPDLREVGEMMEADPVSRPAAAGPGIYWYEEGRLSRIRAKSYPMTTISDYFTLNFRLLNDPGIYVLPGYSSEPGVHLGMNVAIMPECSIVPPVLLGDNIRLERGCRLRGEVIVGRNVIVDRGTDLRRSIVLEHTFIGRDMELDGKIVSADRVIDPVSGCYADQPDELTAGMRGCTGFDWLRIWEICLALALIVLLSVPWAAGRIRALFGRTPGWARRFPFTVWPELWRVTAGRSRLIKPPGYTGEYIFTASEGLSGIRIPEQEEIDDLYFQHHRSMRMIFNVAIKGVINRSMSNEIS